MSNNKKALKSGIWYTVSNFLVRGLGFITTPIFTRLLTKEQFGSYNNYTSWLNILTILVTLNLESTLISARYDYEEKFDKYIFSVLSLSSLSAVIWIGVVNCFSDAATNYFGLNRFYLNCMLVYLLFYPAINLYQVRERYYFKYKATVLISMLMAVGTSLLSVLLVIAMSNRLTGRVLGNVIPVVLIGVVLYVFFIVKGKKIDVSYWKYAVRICLPYIPHLLSLTLLGSMDRVMITKICGDSDNALYSLAYNCGSLVTLLMSSLNSAYAPWLGEKLSLKDYESVRNFSKIYISAFSYMSVGIMALAPEILWLMGGSGYMEAKYVMTPVAMGCICQFLYTMFVNVEQFNKKTVGMAFASASAALLNYILNSIFIPRFGYIAAAYTTLAGFIWLLLVHMFLVYRMKMNRTYSYRFIAGVVCVTGICTLVMNYLYTQNVVRYVFVAVYAVIFILVVGRNRKKLLSLWKKE